MTDNDSTAGGFQNRFFQWLFTQGASTVLLFAIVAALWYGLPALLQQQRADDQKKTETFTEAIKQQRTDFSEINREQRKEYLDSTKETSERVGTSMDRLREAIEKAKQ